MAEPTDLLGSARLPVQLQHRLLGGPLARHQHAIVDGREVSRPRPTDRAVRQEKNSVAIASNESFGG